MSQRDDLLLAQLAGQVPYEEDEMLIEGSMPRNIPMEPAQIDAGPPMSPGGVPMALFEQSKSYQDRLLDMINSPEYQQKQMELTRNGRAAIEDQRKGIQENEQAVQGLEAAGPSVNLAPLTSLVDAWTGSKFTNSYNQPESADDRKMKIMNIKNMLQQQRRGLSEAEISLLKSQLGQMLSPTQLMKQGASGERSERKFGKDVDDKIAGKFESATKDLETLGSKYGNLQASLASGDINKIRPSLSVFARLIADEKGSLSEGDTARVMANDVETQLAKLENYFQKGGTVNSHVVKSMAQLAAQSKKFLRHSFKQRLDKTRDSLEALPSYRGSPAISSLYDINQKQIELALGKDEPSMPKAQSSSAPKPKKASKSIDEMSDEELAREYNAKFGKGN